MAKPATTSPAAKTEAALNTALRLAKALRNFRAAYTEMVEVAAGNVEALASAMTETTAHLKAEGDASAESLN